MDTWTTLIAPPNARSFITYPEFETVVPLDLGTSAEVPPVTGPTGSRPAVWGGTFSGTVGVTGSGGVTLLGTVCVTGSGGVTSLGTVGGTFSGVVPTATFITVVEAVPASQDPLAKVRVRSLLTMTMSRSASWIRCSA